jgi:hypothetical protein
MATNASKLSLLATNVSADGTSESTTLDGLDSSQFLRSDQLTSNTGGINVTSGNISVGGTELTSSGLKLPTLTTAQRTALALGTPNAGTMIYNIDKNSAEFWDGEQWIATNLLPTISVDGNVWDTSTSDVLRINFQSVTDTITLKVYNKTTDMDLVTVSDIDTSLGYFDFYPTTEMEAIGSSWTSSIGSGQLIEIYILNADGTPSNAVEKTVLEPPSGTGSLVAYSADGFTDDTAGWRYHGFTSSGTFTIHSGTFQVEYLVVAGGGAGSKAHQTNVCGGGGAGGYRNSCSVPGELSGGNTSVESAITLGPGTYTVTVGAGGTCAQTTSNTLGTSGSNSSFHTITSIGGGRGGYFEPGTGASGGSGGGAGSYNGSATQNYSGGSGTSGQGFAGAAYNGGTNGGGGGGGGGASQTPAARGSNTTGGVGGNGLYSAISGASYPRAAGGAGSGWQDASGGTGGIGGGGNAGTNSTNGTSGTVNTGSGGGAAKGATYAGNGGSGVVIVRYRVSQATV